MRTKTLKVERLREKLIYDDEHWGFLKNTNSGKTHRAGTIHRCGKRVIMIDGVLHFEHRLVIFYHTGEMPKGKVYHLNNDTLDNRFKNLTTRRTDYLEWQRQPKESSILTNITSLVAQRSSDHAWLTCP